MTPLVVASAPWFLWFSAPRFSPPSMGWLMPVPVLPADSFLQDLFGGVWLLMLTSGSRSACSVSVPRFSAMLTLPLCLFPFPLADSPTFMWTRWVPCPPRGFHLHLHHCGSDNPLARGHSSGLHYCCCLCSGSAAWVGCSFWGSDGDNFRQRSAVYFLCLVCSRLHPQPPPLPHYCLPPSVQRVGREDAQEVEGCPPR